LIFWAAPSFSFSASPALGQRIWLFLKVGDLFLQASRAGPWTPYRFPSSAPRRSIFSWINAVDLVQFLRLGIHLHAQPRGGLVHQVDRLVGQEAVGDVAVRQVAAEPRARYR
jgi:hypothetical protein